MGAEDSSTTVAILPAHSIIATRCRSDQHLSTVNRRALLISTVANLMDSPITTWTTPDELPTPTTRTPRRVSTTDNKAVCAAATLHQEVKACAAATPHNESVKACAAATSHHESAKACAATIIVAMTTGLGTATTREGGPRGALKMTVMMTPSAGAPPVMTRSGVHHKATMTSMATVRSVHRHQTTRRLPVFAIMCLTVVIPIFAPIPTPVR